MEYRSFTVAFTTAKDDEYRVHIYAESEEQALRIARRKFCQFCGTDFRIVS